MLMQPKDFIDYIKFEKRYSHHTVEAYEKDILQFSDYLHTTYDISQIDLVDQQHIRSWMVELVNSEISPRSINRKLSALKSYYNKINIHFKVTNLSYKLRHTIIALNYMSRLLYILTWIDLE